MKAGRLGRMPAKMAIGQHAVHAVESILVPFDKVRYIKCGINTTLHLESRSLFSSSMADSPIHFLAGWRERRGD